MNFFLLVAGVIGFVGGWAHTILGDRWVVAQLDPDDIASKENTGDQNKRYIRWFWHVGSVVLLSTSALLIAHGGGLMAVARQLLFYVSFQWLMTSFIFFVLALRPPAQALKMVPGLVGIPVNALILVGLLW